MIPLARSRRADHDLHRSGSTVALGAQGAGHVDARARLGAVAHRRPRRGRHEVHRARRLPLQERRPERRAAPRLLRHRRRRPHALRSFPAASRCATRFRSSSRTQTIDYLRGIAEQQPGAVVVFGDDGEKFGTWPDTKKHVYDDGWLRQFFDALLGQPRLAARSPRWPKRSRTCRPLGKVYLPDGSYREMTEWALPVESAARIRPRRARAGARSAAGRGSSGSSGAASGGTSR